MMAVDFNSSSEALVVQTPGQLTLGRVANNVLRPSGNPAFHVYKSGGVPRDTTILFNNITFNVGNGYNPATGLFTAPITGIYHFKAEILLHNTYGEYRLYMWSSGRTPRQVIYYQGANNSYHTLHVEGVYNLTKGESVNCSYGGPADAVGHEQNNFSGHFVG